MTIDHLAGLKAAFAFLEQGGHFTLAENSYWPEAFGNATLLFTSPDALIRVVRDRGQVSVDVSPAGPAPEWFDLDAVLQALGVHARDLSITGDPNADPHDLAAVVQRSLTRIRRMVSPVEWADGRRRVIAAQEARMGRGSD